MQEHIRACEWSSYLPASCPSSSWQVLTNQNKVLRQLTNHNPVYVPCSMTVSVSWMSFWLDHKAVPARVALGVTTLLAMSTTQASIQNSLPPVAYTKAIDVWSGVCVFFVFGALLEYAMVNYASRLVHNPIELSCKTANWLNQISRHFKFRCYPQMLHCCRHEARNCLHCCCTFL